MEDLLLFIQSKIEEHEEELTQLHLKYQDGDFYSKDDSAMMDYHEGAIEALSVIQFRGQELLNV